MKAFVEWGKAKMKEARVKLSLRIEHIVKA